MTEVAVIAMKDRVRLEGMIHLTQSGMVHLTVWKMQEHFRKA